MNRVANEKAQRLTRLRCAKRFPQLHRQIDSIALIFLETSKVRDPTSV